LHPLHQSFVARLLSYTLTFIFSAIKQAVFS
jgi:hypothetical protein